MGFLKKNGPALLALALCAVLAAALLRQSGEISRLQAELTEQRQTAEHWKERLEERDAALQALQAGEDRRTPSVTFANPTVNTADRLLSVDVIAELPDAAERSLTIGFCRPGEPWRMAWKQERFRRSESGAYTQTVTFPLDLEMGLELRLEDDTVLFSSDSVTELLPLRLSRGSTSWHYSSRERTLSQCDWSAGLMDPAGREVQAADGEFRVYRNGTLVFTGRQMPDSTDVEVNGEILDGVGLDCAPGDRIRISYACTDSFGLRYEFPFFERLAMRWDDMEELPVSYRPTVTWPE